MGLNEFVKQNFGDDAVAKLGFIRRGGDSNEKGSSYERTFTAHKIIEAWALHQQNAADILFTLQDLSFVDDLAITNTSARTKVNYQAKNSSEQAAAYTDDMHQRFVMQTKIDQEFFGIENTKQVLLVPCNKRCQSNNKSIAKKLNGNTAIGVFISEYFPYVTNQIELYDMAVNLRANICAIITKNDLSSIDNAFRLVVGAMDGRLKFNLQEVIDKARELAKPDLFMHLGIESVEPPTWLVSKVNALDNVTLVVKSRDFFISCNGFEVRVSADIVEPSEEKLRGITNPYELISLLMALATQEYKVAQEEDV